MEEVFITYEKDGYGGLEVGNVFGSLKSARKFVITHIFGNTNTAYHGKTEDELNVLADEHIECHEVQA